MPELIGLYLTAMLYYRTIASCVALSEALRTVSHDRLTRWLHADWSGHTLLELACRTLFVWERGYLIIDDTVVPKPFATTIEGLAWVFSSQERKPVYGLSLVLLVWTNGTLRVPLGVRLWHKGGPSKYALALEWLGYARHRLRCRPAYVLFDAWYPSKVLLKRIHDYRWSFVCRLKKNRRFNGHAVRHHRRHPYWAESGWLTGGLKVLVVRYGAKDLCHQPPDVVRGGSPAAVSRSRPDRRGDQRLQGPTQPDGLSSALRAGPAPSYQLLPGGLLCARAGTA